MEPTINIPGFTMSPSVPALRPGGSIGQMAAQAIKAVVPGYVAGDGRRYAESLKKNFQIQLKDGSQVVEWAPASLGGASNPADLTGAMASFYHHASARITQAREELRKLEPMCAANYEECCEDIRLVIRAKLDELESAFGADCGPCEQWVEEVFSLLLGSEVSSSGDECTGDDGLVGRLLDEYTEEGVAHCPEEEVRLAKARIFRSTLISLHGEWQTFAGDFLSGTNRSSSLIVQRLGQRATVIARSIQIIRDGLGYAGYSMELLSVELLDDEEENSQSGFLKKDLPAGPTACCAMARLEAFASSRVPALLKAPGLGAFVSLATESCQLKSLACSVRGWLMSKLAGKRDHDPCWGPKERYGQDTAFLHAAEGAGAIGLALRGVMAAAYSVHQQMKHFHGDVSTLLPNGVDHHQDHSEFENDDVWTKAQQQSPPPVQVVEPEPYVPPGKSKNPPKKKGAVKKRQRQKVAARKKSSRKGSKKP